MRCRECGAQLPEDAKFCRECGAKVTAPENEIQFCRECGRKLEPDSKFCPGCGKPVKQIPLPELDTEATDSKDDKSEVNDKTDSEVEQQKPFWERNAGKTVPSLNTVLQEENKTVPPPLPRQQTAGSNTGKKGEQSSPELEAKPNMFLGFLKRTSKKMYEKFMEFWKPLSRYGKAMTICFLVLALLTVIAFCAGKVLAGIIAVAQLIIAAVSCLMHYGKLKETKPKVQNYLLLVMVILLLPYFFSYKLGGSHETGDHSPTVSDSVASTENAVPQSNPTEETEAPQVKASTEQTTQSTVDVETNNETSEPVEESTVPSALETECTVVTTEPIEYPVQEETTSADKENPFSQLWTTFNCQENMIFSKYDVHVFLEDLDLGVVKHGESDTFIINLENKQYTLKLVSEEDEDTYGTIELNVTGNQKVTLGIQCFMDRIEIEQISNENFSPMRTERATLIHSSDELVGRNINAVFNELYALGFTNTTNVEVRDAENEKAIGTIKSISIDGRTSFSKEEDFDPNCEVVFEIHTSAWTDQEMEGILQTAIDQPAAVVMDLIDENQWENIGFSVSYSVNGAYETDFNPEGKYLYTVTVSTEIKEIMLSFLTEEAFNAQDTLNQTFPQENALKAAVVALTNGQATDVFAWDGNSYDVSKFHNYTDLNGFYLTVLNKGVWRPVNDHTWHVDLLQCMMSGTGTCIMADMDISSENGSYQISNLDKTIASKENLFSTDASKINFEHCEPSENTPYLTVPAWKIQGDRDPAAEKERNNRTMPTAERNQWIENQFSSWDGHHKQLTEMIKANLNDERSYDHIETNYVDITSKEILNDVTKNLNATGIYKQLEVGDLLIMVEFSAKNAFNATIKGEAIGIARYSANTIELIYMN